mmetsp:Transcript_5933/g.22530  ORF Transcript_5933/g.22530 Transcript_5933/m.22530 type:complete len:86 (-) Transcript_5933:194-451(-)
MMLLLSNGRPGRYPCLIHQLVLEMRFIINQQQEEEVAQKSSKTPPPFMTYFPNNNQTSKMHSISSPYLIQPKSLNQIYKQYLRMY